MQDMPASVVWWYQHWLNEYPESFHALDVGRFYAFVHELLRVAKKPRSRWWLEDNLRADCSKLSEDDIKRYGQMFETITEYEAFWRTPQGISYKPLIFARRVEDIKRQHSNFWS